MTLGDALVAFPGAFFGALFLFLMFGGGIPEITVNIVKTVKREHHDDSES